MTETTPKALPVLLKEIFALPSEGFAEFKRQYEQLTEKDRADFRAMLTAEGYAVKE